MATLAAPLVSVLVATKDRPGDLARLLPTVLAQDEPRFELFVIDQSTSDATEHLMRGFAGDERIIYVRQRETGKSKALNLALRLAGAPVLTFTDDDCTVPRDWLSTALQLVHATPASGLLFASFVPAAHDERTEYIPAIAFAELRVIRGGPWRSHSLVGMGGNMFATRQLLDAVGGFDEDLGPGGPLRTGEECELTFRTMRAGFSVIQSPTPVVTHWGVRQREGGAARRMVNDGFFAMGAGYGKHIRELDAHAAVIALHDTAWSLAQSCRAVIERKGPFHARRMAMYWKGLVSGIVAGPNISAPSSNRSLGGPGDGHQPPQPS